MEDQSTKDASGYFTENSIEIHQIPDLSELTVVETCSSSEDVQRVGLAETHCFDDLKAEQSECDSKISTVEFAQGDDGVSNVDTNIQHVLLVTRPSQMQLESWSVKAGKSLAQTSPGKDTVEVESRSQREDWITKYKPSIRHSGWLIKRGHSIRNYKRRLFFIVDDKELVYHDAHDSSDVRGRVDLEKDTHVQAMLHSGFRLLQNSYEMILFALDAHDRDVWIEQLTGCKQVTILEPGAHTVGRISDIKQSENSSEVILCSGWLRKRGNVVKSIKRRWFELTCRRLSYLSDPVKKSKKGDLEIGNARIMNLDVLKSGERHSFSASTSSRTLILYADSEEERALWVAHLSSVAGGDNMRGNKGQCISLPETTIADLERSCSCMHIDTNPMSRNKNAPCRRCTASFISKSEDALMDVSREVMLILASPYSPEGSTTAAFLKQLARSHSAKKCDVATLRLFMVELADYMIFARMNELAMLGGNPNILIDQGSIRNMNSAAYTAAAVAFSDRIIAILHGQIEERMLHPFYRTIVDQFTAQSLSEAKIIGRKMNVLRSKSQFFFGLNAKNISSSNWSGACSKLKLVDSVELPYLKKKNLIQACHEIYAIYNLEHQSNAPMSADDFIPAFIYVLIHSDIDNPLLLKDLIAKVGLGSPFGEDAYFVSCLEIALEYIRPLLTACTAVLDANRNLGIQFTYNLELRVVVVHEIVPESQAAQCRTINVGDVLIAVNGVPVHKLGMEEVIRNIQEARDSVEMCLLSVEEYKRRVTSIH
uniref:Uncharacterized protein AlNc14C68G4782 n=1 Tax=Albugo laibachii Nc14 TaxID=890382 RepID=F0WDR3_9STRA|nr:conserved hypothetical protein [Albugo laibachii Nc14]|eukprot:CCA19340.1 conserved hypothetical protein [Albugo laibachii Nc14]